MMEEGERLYYRFTEDLVVDLGIKSYFCDAFLGLSPSSTQTSIIIDGSFYKELWNMFDT